MAAVAEGAVAGREGREVGWIETSGLVVRFRNNVAVAQDFL